MVLGRQEGLGTPQTIPPPAYESRGRNHDCPLTTLPVVTERIWGDAATRSDGTGRRGPPASPAALPRGLRSERRHRGLGSVDSEAPATAGSDQPLRPVLAHPAPHTHHLPASRVPGRRHYGSRGRGRSLRDPRGCRATRGRQAQVRSDRGHGQERARGCPASPHPPAPAAALIGQSRSSWRLRGRAAPASALGPVLGRSEDACL